MKLTFLGAAHEVTGSLTLLEVGKTKLLIDCGMEQGRDIFENQDLPLSPAGIDAVLLTHAHIDHAGNLPLLSKNGFRGSVYCTEPTASLSQVMLRDSAHIQEFEAEWRNRKAKRAGTDLYTPLYTVQDAEAVLRRFRPCRYGDTVRIAEGVEIRFVDAGHLLGSASIEVRMWEGNETRTVVFSGDIGSHDRPILKNPQTVENADYVMIESTYGNRLHGKRGDGNHINMLADILGRTFRRGGNVVIPSFAVGRTQEILYDLRALKEENLLPEFPNFPIYMDSPLAGEATRIFMQCGEEHMDGEAAELLAGGINPFWPKGLILAETADASKAINRDKKPKVIISASGMCEAGRIRHHLKHNLWRPECTVLFVGYQAEGTLGRAIWEGAPSVRLFSEDVEVRAEICTLSGISGHADRDGLVNWLSGFRRKPRRVFVNHGDDDSATDFAAHLNGMGYAAYAPYSGTEFDLIRGEFLYEATGKPVKKANTPTARASTVYADLCRAAEDLLQFAKECRGRPNKELAAFADSIRNLIRKQK